MTVKKHRSENVPPDFTTPHGRGRHAPAYRIVLSSISHFYRTPAEDRAGPDASQSNALRDIVRLTDAQDRIMKRAVDLIRQPRFAARGCFQFYQIGKEEMK